MSQQPDSNRQKKRELSEADLASLTRAVRSLYTRFPTLREEEKRWALELLDDNIARNT